MLVGDLLSVSYECLQISEATDEFNEPTDQTGTRCHQLQLPITNYQMAPSKRGAGGGSATHKEPT